MSWEAIAIVLLIIANGIFAMAEIAVVSSRKARLMKRAETGGRGARAALRLAENPDDFLSTVQVGITLIGILAGAFGGATVARQIEPAIASFPTLAPYASSISISLVVIIITYLSLIIGELAPKRIALSAPEKIAAALAPWMAGIARLAHPAVQFLSWSTDIVLKLVPGSSAPEPPVTEDEIRLLINQATQAGVFQPGEQELVAGVFRLGDRRVTELMTPRHDVVWIDLSWTEEAIRRTVAENPHSMLPVAEGDLDHLAGVVHVRDLFAHSGSGQFNLRSLLRAPAYVPEGTRALRVLEMFRSSATAFAVILDEHGSVEGVLTMTDLLGAVVGPGKMPDREEEHSIVRREDGSLLIDGAFPIAELKELLPLRELPREDEGAFNTVGGLVMMNLERVPRTGDVFETGGWRFEVVDMDGNRVDEILVSGPGHGQPEQETS
jgi:putative hemolysin